MENPLYREILNKIGELTGKGYIVYCVSDENDYWFELALPNIFCSFRKVPKNENGYYSYKDITHATIKVNGKEIDIGSTNSSMIAYVMLSKYDQVERALKTLKLMNTKN